MFTKTNGILLHRSLVFLTAIMCILLPLMLNFYLRQKFFYLDYLKLILLRQQQTLNSSNRLMFLPAGGFVSQSKLFTEKRVKLVHIGKNYLLLMLHADKSYISLLWYLSLPNDSLLKWLSYTFRTYLDKPMNPLLRLEQ